MGWKIGFNLPEVQEKLGIDRPLAGFLTSDGLLEDGATWSIGGDGEVIVESEVAVEVGDDGRSIVALLPPSSWPTLPTFRSTSSRSWPATSSTAPWRSARASERLARRRAHPRERRQQHEMDAERRRVGASRRWSTRWPTGSLGSGERPSGPAIGSSPACSASPPSPARRPRAARARGGRRGGAGVLRVARRSLRRHDHRSSRCPRPSPSPPDRSPPARTGC